jgi:hypothetical protein
MIPAHIEHVFKALDQRDPRAAVTGHKCNRAALEGSSPHGDTGTAGVTALRQLPAYERFVGHLLDLLDDDQADKASDVLRNEWRAIHGVG